jgi:hypothetical protein
MTSLRKLAFIPMLALFLFCTRLSAFADPPARAVRLKYISGAVSIQPGGVNDWVAAVVNRPLTTADRVWTDQQARAELNLGSAALRMNAETSLTLTDVSDDIVQIELDQGTLNLHIRHLFGGETYEIDTPNQAFTILKAGDYRFDVDPNADSTSVTVWRGQGEANGQGPGVKLHSDQQASFTGGTSLEHRIANAPGLDGFDDWCRVRDEREDHAKSYQYVSADVVGADDLDEYGTWRVVGTYGPVWVPAVPPGWAPYHNGHWVWVEPWGWTWVDDAPWGFAPCHYGRWVYAGGYWAWAPGPAVVARPVYAPALVAWVGGAHWGASVSFGAGGGVGWFPLGWGEPYVPSYTVSRTYFEQVNVTNTHITNITNVTNNYYVTNNNTTVVNNNIQNTHYANQTVAGAVTAVPARTLTNSEPVAKAAVAVPAGEIKTVSLATAAPVAPVRASVLGAKAGTPTAVPPAQAKARPVVSLSAPPPKPMPFEAKQEALAKTPGRPLDTQTEAQLRARAMRETPAAPAHMLPAAQPGVRPENAQPVPEIRGQTVPHPPQPGESPAAAAHPQPANATRPVPRPPQAAATSNPAGASPVQPSNPRPALNAQAGSDAPHPPQNGSMEKSQQPAPRPAPRPQPGSWQQRQATANAEGTQPAQPSDPRPAPNAQAASDAPHPPQNGSMEKPQQPAARPAPHSQPGSWQQHEAATATANAEGARPSPPSNPRPGANAPAASDAPHPSRNVSLETSQQPAAHSAPHPQPEPPQQHEQKKSQPAKHQEKPEHKNETR